MATAHSLLKASESAGIIAIMTSRQFQCVNMVGA